MVAPFLKLNNALAPCCCPTHLCLSNYSIWITLLLLSLQLNRIKVWSCARRSHGLWGTHCLLHVLVLVVRWLPLFLFCFLGFIPSVLFSLRSLSLCFFHIHPFAPLLLSSMAPSHCERRFLNFTRPLQYILPGHSRRRESINEASGKI